MTPCYNFFVAKFDQGLYQSSFLEKTIFISDLVWIGTFRCPPTHPLFYKQSYFNWHNMITFPRTAVELHILGQETIIGSPNIVAFYNKGQEYFRKKLSENGDWCEWFQFCPKLLFEVLQQFDPQAEPGEKRPFRHSHTLIATKWLLLERQIIEYLETTAWPDKLWVNEMVLQLLDGILADNVRYRGLPTRKKASTQQLHETLVIDAQRLLFQHLHQPPSLTQLAQALHSSPFHLARIFRQQTGKTIHQYLEQLRLRTALEQLPDYANDLSALAHKVGYKNHSHFSHAFRRAFGLPPSQMDYKTAVKRLQNL